MIYEDLLDEARARMAYPWKEGAIALLIKHLRRVNEAAVKFKSADDEFCLAEDELNRLLKVEIGK